DRAAGRVAGDDRGGCYRCARPGGGGWLGGGAGRGWVAAAAGAGRGAGGPGVARGAGGVPGCGACGLGRARWGVEAAAAGLGEARLAWGVWADGIRQLTEQRLGTDDFLDFRVLDDPGYARALEMGTPFEEAVKSAGTALAAASGGEDLVAGGHADCLCLAVK